MIGARVSTWGVVAGLILVIMLGLYWKGHREGGAEQRAKTEAAEVRATVAAAEVSGERASAARVDVVVRQQSAGQDIARNLAVAAKKSEDGDVPLANDRVLRLRNADGELCRLNQELVGCGAPP